MLTWRLFNVFFTSFARLYNGAHQKDPCYPLGDDTPPMLKETEAEYKILFLGIARDRRVIKKMIRQEDHIGRQGDHLPKLSLK